jgi:hypothetical protein
LIKTAVIDKDQEDYLRMAAFVGILRHAKLDLYRKTNKIPLSTRTNLIAALMTTVNQKTPPDTIKRSEAGHVWMRRRAIEIVGILGGLEMASGDTTNSVLQSIVADRDEAPSLRCTAAATLRLTSKTAKIDSLVATEKLGELATQICRRELAWIDAELAKRPKAAGVEDGLGGMGGFSGMSGMGRMSGMGGMSGGEDGEGGFGGEEDEGGFGGLGGLGGLGGRPGMGGAFGGSGAMGGFGGESSDTTKDPRVDLARRRLKYQLICVDVGLSGVGKIDTKSSDEATKREKILERFAAIMKATDLVDLEADQPKSLDTLAKQVRSAMNELEAITGGPPPEPEAEIEEPEISAEPSLDSGPAAGPGTAAKLDAGPEAGPTVTPAPADPAPAPADATPAPPGDTPPAIGTEPAPGTGS